MSITPPKARYELVEIAEASDGAKACRHYQVIRNFVIIADIRVTFEFGKDVEYYTIDWGKYKLIPEVANLLDEAIRKAVEDYKGKLKKTKLVTVEALENHYDWRQILKRGGVGA